MALRFLTAGESHGPGLTIMVDPFPAGVPLSSDAINKDLYRRQQGYGRGGRQLLEKDKVQFKAGVRFGHSTGAPIALFVENRDFANWQGIMDAEGEANTAKAFTLPRPGHADLAAYYKYGYTDLRDALERASARETAARVAAGGLAKALLNACGIEVMAFVSKLGGLPLTPCPQAGSPDADWEAFGAYVEGNDLRCAATPEAQQAVRTHIDATRKAGSTLGGEVVCWVQGLPPGLGSHAQWDRKLDGRLAQAVMSIQAVKAVALGAGDEGAELDGSLFHDPIAVSEVGEVFRPQNKAGGLEGGITNGAPLVLKAQMKPIATLLKALPSVDLATGQAADAHFERSDVTAVPACAVVVEAMVALVLADALMEKFGQDCLVDIAANLATYRARLKPPPQA
jgi:chorismate synthase